MLSPVILFSPPTRVLIIGINFAEMIYCGIMQCSQSGIHGLNPTAGEGQSWNNSLVLH